MSPVDFLIQKVLPYFAPPFSSWRGFGEALFHQVLAVNDFETPHAWPYLLTSLLIAWLVYRWGAAARAGESFWAFAFPPALYGHRSARADYGFVAFDLATRSFFVAPLSSALGWGVYKAAQAVLPAVHHHAISDPVVRGVTASIAALLIFDFGYYVAHYLMHRIPSLWHFHEVHHSAEVLTPVTGYRVHPMERLVMGVVVSLFTAVAALFYSRSFDQEARFLDLFGANAVLIALYSLGFQLRHSHIWFSYGPVGEHLLISPAQHQIHHSKDPKHWNKNFGYNLAAWDLLFGTLYVTHGPEALEYGVPGTDPADFATVPRLYLLPFAKAARGLRERLTPPAGQPERGLGSGSAEGDPAP
jgi:sterol desaturase/sphingolipid hydroxylase (fatty acid hydroxylase superfamily)